MKTFKISKISLKSYFNLKDSSINYYSKKSGIPANGEFAFITKKDLIKICKKLQFDDTAIENLIVILNNGLSLFDFYEIYCSMYNNQKDTNTFKKMVRLIKYCRNKKLNFNIYKLILKRA